MFTYEIAPAFILMEHECLGRMREIIGFHQGDSILAPGVKYFSFILFLRRCITNCDIDFTFAGGSISNMYALMIARHQLYPQHKKYGMRAIKGQLMMYTSQHVGQSNIFLIDFKYFSLQHHYSIKGGASAIGLGLDNCVQVACDERYQQFQF